MTDSPTGPPPKTFSITTTAQVERTYEVQASTQEQADDRLHIHLKDPDTLREGVVVEQTNKQRDATPQRITRQKAKQKPAQGGATGVGASIPPAS